MAAVISNWESSYEGFVPDLETVQQVIKDYEEESVSKFVVAKKDKLFGCTNQEFKSPKTGRVYFESAKKKSKGANIKFDGIPFVYVGKRILACHQGKDKHTSDKPKYWDQVEHEQRQDHSFKKQRYLAQNTKKCNCPVSCYDICTSSVKVSKLQVCRVLEQRKSFNIQSG